jgi:AraC family transcriptional regulator
MGVATASLQATAAVQSYFRVPDASSGIRVLLTRSAPGVLKLEESSSAVIAIHFGRSTFVTCHRAGHFYRGMAVHGDIDILPPDTPVTWETHEGDQTLAIVISPKFLDKIGEELEVNPGGICVRFGLRDRQIEFVGWTLKAEIEGG